VSQDFGYDDESRLVSTYSGADIESYQYDLNGNRSSQVVNGTSTPDTVSTTSNRLASVGAQSYGYDAQGNTTTVAGAATYHYDVFNRMDSAGGMAYYVNPEGQRLRKSGAAGTSYFAPDHSGAMLAEYGSGGWTDYVWLNGRLIGRVAGGQRYAIHDDQTGRPEAVTDGSGAVVWRAQNFAFTQNVTVASVTLNLGFPGQYYDAETGLWNNGFRDYKSALGRYVESDPAGLAGGANTYAYASGNPLSFVDPYGLDWQLSWTIASGSVAVPGAGASANVTVGINFPSFNPSTWSLYGTVQGAGGVGGGVFAGFGEGFNVSHGDAATTGTSSSNYAEINAGWEIAGGLNTTWDDCGKTTGVLGAAGAWAGGGWGVGGFVGRAWSATYALPSFGSW
jgi:RHS repeat-associated protein